MPYADPERGYARKRERLKDPEYRARLHKKQLARHHERRKTDPEYVKTRRGYGLKRFGLTPDDYEKLLQAQLGCCAICNEPNSFARPLHVDHCHVSKRIRGLLCGECNTGIGKLGDSAEGVAAALRYLAKDLT